MNINNELRRRLNGIDKEYNDILLTFISELSNSQSYQEEKKVTEKFNNALRRYVAEEVEENEIN